LQPQDYAQLQRVAAARPIDWPRSWAERPDRIPSPKWIYYTLQGEELRRFDTVAIPDLEVAVSKARGMAKEIPDAIAKELVARKIFREALRQDRNGGLVLAGGMTSAAWGSALLGSVQTAAGTGFASEQHFLLVEFKIIVDNKPVGAIQVYAQRFAGLGAVTLGLAQGSLTSQMASGVAESMKGLKSGSPEQASEINCLPSNFK